MNPELIDVAKALIEMGANINAYRPGRFLEAVYFGQVIYSIARFRRSHFELKTF